MRIKALVLAAALAALPATAFAQEDLKALEPRAESERRMQESQQLLREEQVRQQMAERERAVAELDLRLRTEENLRRMEDQRRALVAQTPPSASAILRPATRR